MTNSPPDFSSSRSHFPAFEEVDDDGNSFVFFDGPAGTQVPREVIDAVATHYRRSNALDGGEFIISQRCSAIVDGARAAMADFLNAPSPDEIIFGPNMTTLTYSMSRAIGRMLDPGDEAIVSRLDHDANVTPWKTLAERGIAVREARFDPDECRLDLDHLASLISPKTRLVAVGYASNLVGTINPVARIAELAHAVGAWLYVDAVHYAPHGPIDVPSIDCDFLVCSAYKFFGPHVGALWAKRGILESITPYQVEPADKSIPVGFETGMLNFEGLAGTIAAIDYLGAIGQDHPVEIPERWQSAGGRRTRLKRAMTAIAEYERDLCGTLIELLSSIQGLRIYGIIDTASLSDRCPTISFRIEGHTPADICHYLGERNIFAWHGNNYALGVTRDLGIEESGGVVRVGIAHYNTRDDVQRLTEALEKLVSGYVGQMH